MFVQKIEGKKFQRKELKLREASRIFSQPVPSVNQRFMLTVLAGTSTIFKFVLNQDGKLKMFDQRNKRGVEMSSFQIPGIVIEYSHDSKYRTGTLFKTVSLDNSTM